MGAEANSYDELDLITATPTVQAVAATLADIRSRLARCERELAGVLGNLGGLAVRLADDEPGYGCSCGCG